MASEAEVVLDSLRFSVFGCSLAIHRSLSCLHVHSDAVGLNSRCVSRDLVCCESVQTPATGRG